jgi:AraC-like DNA-binding protein/mannose-6-phosphate isomerase-like protein (cupin superfamily)
MSSTSKRIEAMKPLTTLERAFKFLHASGLSYADLKEAPPGLAEILSGHPSEEAEFWNIRAFEIDDVLDEHMFFDEDADIFINIHPRYMPAPPHTHHFFELQYILSGSLTQSIGDGTLRMGTGDVCFIAPGTKHTLLVFDDDTLIVNILIRKDTFRSTFINLLRTNDIISDFFTRVLYSNSFYPFILCRACSEQELASVILNMIRVRRENRRYKDRLLRAMLEEFFIYLLRDHEYDFVTASACGGDHRNVVAMLSYIQQNFRTVSLSGTARFFNYNEAHLSRMIRAYTGSGFSQIVKTIKLQHAANLLEGTVVPVSDVIADSGYEDKTYFYREFKKKYGSTPAVYRRNSRKQIGRQETPYGS